MPLQRAPDSSYHDVSLQEPEETKKKRAIYRMNLPSPQFTALIEFKIVYVDLWVMNYFPPGNPFFYRRNVASFSLLYHYFYDQCYNELYSLVPPEKTFNNKTRDATYSGDNSFTFSSYSIKKKDVLFVLLLPKNFYSVTPEWLLPRPLQF